MMKESSSEVLGMLQILTFDNLFLFYNHSNKNSWDLFSCYTRECALHASYCWIHTRIIQDKNYYFLHFTEEKNLRLKDIE